MYFQYLSTEINASIPDENNRKRRCNEASDDVMENSKRIRSILSRIDLSSDSSISMDCSSDSEDEIQERVDNINSSNNHNDVHVPTTSAESNAHFTNESPNVNIINVEIIQPVVFDDQQEPIVNENISAAKNSEVQSIAQEEQRQSNNDDQDKNQNDRRERKESDSNRIVISDSSDDEEDNGTTYNNRRHSDSNFASSSFSFADADGRFESRASFDANGNSYRYRNRFREFNQQRASNVNNNINRIMRDAHETVARNIRHANHLSQNILSTFQSHFRPLFNATQQQYTRNYYR